MLRIRDFECTECGESFEELLELTERAFHCGKEASRRITAPSYIWKCDRGGSTAPRRSDHNEPRRREAKHERVVTMLDKQGQNEKNLTGFMDPKTARKR